MQQLFLRFKKIIINASIRLYFKGKNIMNEELFNNLHVNTRISHIMGIQLSQLLTKIEGLEKGKNPIIKRGEKAPVLFEPEYIAAQMAFYSQLAEIAEFKLKELEENKN